MAITWNLLGCKLGNDDNLTVSVQEVVDEVEGKIYSARFHKKHPKEIFLAALKEQIKADRAKAKAETTIKTTIDLGNFEDYLKA